MLGPKGIGILPDLEIENQEGGVAGSFSSPRLLAGLIPPEEEKARALATILKRPVVAENPGAVVHFVDDRLPTLEYLATRPDLDDVRLWLADWGYVTPTERARAGATASTTTSTTASTTASSVHPSSTSAKGRAGGEVRVLSRASLVEWLTWGLMMGVDDGCEPTMEEIIDGVANTPPS